MGDDNFSRLKGRGLANKLNQHIIFSLFLSGASMLGLLVSLICLIISPSFILLIIFFSWLSMFLLRHLKKVSGLRSKLNSSLYTTDDKSYVWDLENVRDKLMARIIQEGICPWNEGPCNSQNLCFCKKQKEHLDDMNLDITQKQKILLNERDADC